MKLLSPDQWIAWLGATAVAAVTLTAFVYANFETKDSFNSYKSHRDQVYELLEKRLDRIDNKLDQIIISNGTSNRGR